MLEALLSWVFSGISMLPFSVTVSPRPGLGIVLAVLLKDMWTPERFAVRCRGGYQPLS